MNESVSQIIHVPTQYTARLSKKLRKAFSRALIDLQPVGKPFSQNDLAAFRCLVGIEAKQAVKIPNPEYPKDTRHIYVDGSPFSWVRAIEEYSDASYLKKIMRNIVSCDLRDFLSAVEPQECNCCGATDDLTVDHVDLPFDTIATQFIDQYGPIQINEESSRVGGAFLDINLEAKWIAYHAANAVYQVLCRSCNARKGKNGRLT